MKASGSPGRLSFTAMLLATSLGIWGCAHGLNEVMGQYHFVPISPPQSNWENGSVVEIDPRFPSAPVLRSMPSMVPVGMANIDHNAPNVSQTHDEKLDLSLGVSIPAEIKAGLSAQGVRQYSVVAEGNIIQSVPLDSYATDTFPKIAEKYGARWTRALKEKQLYYFYEIWVTKKLTYKFYNEKGASAQLSVPIKVPVELSASWKATDDGSLVYEGPGVICVGYRARPIREAESGEPVIQSTGGITAGGKQAEEALTK